jgi:hypothetical protein
LKKNILKKLIYFAARLLLLEVIGWLNTYKLMNWLWAQFLFVENEFALIGLGN